jgi:hypothetical protein
VRLQRTKLGKLTIGFALTAVLLAMPIVLAAQEKSSSHLIEKASAITTFM